MSFWRRLTSEERVAFLDAALAFEAMPDRECLAECDRPKTQHEIEAAIARAAEDARTIQGRREPTQQTLTLAA